MQKIGEGTWKDMEGDYEIVVTCSPAIMNGVRGHAPGYDFETKILPPGADSSAGWKPGPCSAQGSGLPTEEAARDAGFAKARTYIGDAT